MDAVLASLLPMSGIAELSPPRRRGTPRRVGVELEFGGLTESETARTVAKVANGRVQQQGKHEFKVVETAFGTVEVILDTAFRAKAEGAVAELGLELSRAVVPIEIVTEPLAPAKIPSLDHLFRVLRQAGATGSRDGLLLGFGLHLNVETAGDDLVSILPVAQAYALLEDWLRRSDPIDPFRRVLPFVDPYPRRWIDRVAGMNPEIVDLDRFIEAYIEEVGSRNHGLDLLPLLRFLDEDKIVAKQPHSAQIKGRPAYHYRLPDCRIDEEDWSLAYEWNRWCLIERVAADDDLLRHLRAAWKIHRESLTTLRTDWARIVGDQLERWASHA